MARKKSANSLAVRDNTPGGRSNSNLSPRGAGGSHGTSHPKPNGKARSAGGATLAV